MSEWPPTLPRCALRGKQLAPMGNVVSFGTEVGPGKVRRRSTARVARYGLTFVVTRSQAVQFEEWFNDVLEDGSLTFTYTDPLTLEAAEFRFNPQGAYTLQERASGKWDLAVSMDRLP